MNPSIGSNRTDASIFLHLMDLSDVGGEAMDKKAEVRKFTSAELRYWGMGWALLLVGASGAIWGDLIPWNWLKIIAKELGPGIFTAGILALLVEPFFRNEFARDAFLAAFRYVLPTEFREEIEKILRFDFIAVSQVWRVKIEKVSDEIVLVVKARICWKLAAEMACLIG